MGSQMIVGITSLIHKINILNAGNLLCTSQSVSGLGEKMDSPENMVRERIKQGIPYHQDSRGRIWIRWLNYPGGLICNTSANPQSKWTIRILVVEVKLAIRNNYYLQQAYALFECASDTLLGSFCQTPVIGVCECWSVVYKLFRRTNIYW